MEIIEPLPPMIFAVCGALCMSIGARGLFKKVPTLISHKNLAVIQMFIIIGFMVFIFPFLSRQLSYLKNTQPLYLASFGSIFFMFSVALVASMRSLMKHSNKIILLGASIKEYSTLVEDALREMNIAFHNNENTLVLIERNIRLSLTDELRGSGLGLTPDKPQGEEIAKDICMHISTGYANRRIKRSRTDFGNSIYFIMLGIWFIVVSATITLMILRSV